MSDEQKQEEVKAIKGFGPDWKCRGYQFALGGTYKHEGEVKACSSGFHAIEGYPMEVFGYYAPADSKYADVMMRGKISRHGEDSKVAGAELSVRVELKISEIISRSVRFILDRIESAKIETNTGDYSAATNTGNRSAATNTGNQSAATNTGNRSAATNTGNRSAATNTGNQSAATNTGYQSAATNTGDYSAATNTGNRSAATNTGDYSAATNTGNRSAATNTGYQSAATAEGKHSVALASGFYGKAKGIEGAALFLVYRDEDADGDEYGRILHAKAVIVGRDGIKADTFYTLNRDGEIVSDKPETEGEAA